MELKLPETFTKTIRERYGEVGKKWLSELPSIVEQCKEHWNLTLEPNTYEMYYNYISAAQMEDGQEAILKVGFPNEKEVITEVEALQYFDEKHCVKLLSKNLELRAFLLEKLEPATALREIHLKDDAEATRIAIPLLRDVPVPVPKEHHFPSISDWAKALHATKKLTIRGNITNDILDKALSIFEELDSTKTEEKLLHGDLHHDNILYDENRGWIAIDPKGLIGDPAFNAARFIINNWSKVPSTELVEARVTSIAEAFGHTPNRIAGWAYVDYIISNCWMLEENDESKIDVPFAEKLESLYSA